MMALTVTMVRDV